MKNLVAHLKKQLSMKGIDSPETIEPSEMTELSSDVLGMVAGGFGQAVGFSQVFSQTTVPGPGGFWQAVGFSQTFTQGPPKETPQ